MDIKFTVEMCIERGIESLYRAQRYLDTPENGFAFSGTVPDGKCLAALAYNAAVAWFKSAELLIAEEGA